MYGTKKPSWVWFSVANWGHHVTWPSFTQVLHVAGLPPAIFALKCSTLLKNLYESHARLGRAVFLISAGKKVAPSLHYSLFILENHQNTTKTTSCARWHLIVKNKQSSIISSPKLFCLKHLTCGCEITKNVYLAYLFLSNTMCCWLLGAAQILAIQFDSDWPHFLDVETCAEPSSWGFLELKGASRGSKKIDLQGFCWSALFKGGYTPEN